jgi:hypothetical protein
MELYQDVTICTYIMSVNNIPVLMTISRDLKFGTAEALTSRSAKCIMAGIKKVCQVYGHRGFRVRTAHAEFWELKIRLNTTAKGEHVPEIEKYITATKERCRCIYNTMKVVRIPLRRTVELVYASVFWLNMFPSDDGVSYTITPRGLVTGLKLDYNKHCQIGYGEYKQVHEDHDNTMATRTTRAITL